MTFKSPSKSLTPRDYQLIVLVVIAGLIVITALIITNLAIKGGGGDFFVHWVGGRSFLFDRIEPYSGEIATRTQYLVYGTPARAGEKPYFLDTPFPILLLYFPFSLFSNPLLARAVFTSVLELALVGTPILGSRLLERKLPSVIALFIILFGAINFYSIRAIYSASPVLLLGLIYAGILLSLRAETDELTGALLAVSLYYWEVGAPFLFLVMIRIYDEKRRRVLAGFFMLGFILLAISFLLYPAWIIPFLRASVNDWRAGYGYNLFSILGHIWPDHGRAFAWVIIIGLVFLLGREWNAVRGADYARFYWTSSLTLAATPLLGFRTEMDHLAVLVMPVIIVVSVVLGRWPKFGHIVAVTIISMMLVFPWLVYFFGPIPATGLAEELIFLFYPTFTLIALYWVRWWVFREPRTWVDMTSNRYK
jgi:hypothetical protein